MNFSSLKYKALMATGQTGAAALEGEFCYLFTLHPALREYSAALQRPIEFFCKPICT
jgi:hypothetical protein